VIGNHGSDRGQQELRLYLATEEVGERESHRTPGTRGKEFEWVRNYEEFERQ
jgi:hypothetical protein